MKILIADDHTVVRDGLRHVLTHAFPTTQIGECRDGEEALKTLQRESWDLVILDISMPGRSGLEVLDEIKSKWPAQQVLMLSSHSERQYAVRCLKIGAAGFVNKEVACSEIIEAVSTVAAGGRYLTAAVGEQLAEQLGKENAAVTPEDFSTRELYVLRRLLAGHTTSEIAKELSLSPQAISTYRSRILEKTNLETNAQLFAYAKEHDIV